MISALRVLELRDRPYSAKSLNERRTVSEILFHMGYEKEADEAMQSCVELFRNSGIPQAHEVAMEAFIIYSFQCEKPTKAINIAEQLLETKPNHVLSLTVKMLSDVESGEINTAKKTAKRIHSLVEDKHSLSYTAASQVLSTDPNQP